MPRNLASIFGTEEDKVNCSFYFKVGACRHGDRCSRIHMKPNFSQTLLLWHFYMPPSAGPNGEPNDEREHYEFFMEDVLEEMLKFGPVEELVVCENLGDHMFGNTYVKFQTENQAAKALLNLTGRFYGGRMMKAEYSPVIDFREGRCRQFDEHSCLRGGYCNFLHLKPVPRYIRKIMRRARRDRPRSPSPYHERRRDDSWPRFPVRGTTPERQDCIASWNRKLDRKRRRALRAKERVQEERGRSRERDPVPTAGAVGMPPGMVPGMAPGMMPGVPGMPPPMSMPPTKPYAPAEATMAQPMDVDQAAGGIPAPGPFMNPERLAMLGGAPQPR